MNFISYLLELLNKGKSSEEVVKCMDSMIEDYQVHSYKHIIERRYVSGIDNELNTFYFNY
jgi:hypothetical protein